MMTTLSAGHRTWLSCAVALLCWACSSSNAGAVVAPPGSQRGLGFLELAVGDYPGKIGLWNHAVLRPRLSALLGKRRAFFYSNMWNTTVVSRQGRLVYVTGTRQPLAGLDGAVFVADLERNTVWIWLMISGQMFEYREQPLQPELPAEVALFIENWRAINRAGQAPAVSYQ
jgi:hypothetical protein